jgi:hypothetical protein
MPRLRSTVTSNVLVGSRPNSSLAPQTEATYFPRRRCPGFFSRRICYHPCKRFFSNVWKPSSYAGMVRGPEFRLSVKILRRHQTALRGLAAACPQATTASSLFPLFRGEAETLRPRNLAAQVGVAGGRFNRHRASRAGALSAMRQRAAGARGVLATHGVVPFRLRAAKGFAQCNCRRRVVGGPMDAWCSLMLPAVPRPRCAPGSISPSPRPLPRDRRLGRKGIVTPKIIDSSRHTVLI